MSEIYTNEQVLNFEVACELCNTRIAQCSARIGEEEAKAVPDVALIEQVRQDLFAISLERNAVRLTDDAAVAAWIEHSQVELERQKARYWG
ncbi:hypothetical protein ACFOLC_00565 [Lysobacter cavernae]|uniref:Uncharacterized protein n=1 Tax=Lysobacter cavernae TaxID=1685901 RepID=A0ABV7RKX2_9GAMM